MIEDNIDGLITKDELMYKYWTPFRNEVILSPALSSGAKQCYITIVMHIKHGKKTIAWPGQKRLAKMLGVSERSIIGYIKELENVDIISKQRRGQGKSNVYAIKVPDVKKLRLEELNTGDDPINLDGFLEVK